MNLTVIKGDYNSGRTIKLLGLINSCIALCKKKDQKATMVFVAENYSTIYLKMIFTGIFINSVKNEEPLTEKAMVEFNKECEAAGIGLYLCFYIFKSFTAEELIQFFSKDAMKNTTCYLFIDDITSILKDKKSISELELMCDRLNIDLSYTQ